MKEMHCSNFGTAQAYNDMSLFWIIRLSLPIKKILKILKEQSESVNRRTDNTMAKRTRTNNDLQNIHIKLKIESHKKISYYFAVHASFQW